MNEQDERTGQITCGGTLLWIALFVLIGVLALPAVIDIICRSAACG